MSSEIKTGMQPRRMDSKKRTDHSSQPAGAMHICDLQRRCIENTFCRERIQQRTHSTANTFHREHILQRKYSTENAFYRECILEKAIFTSAICNAGVSKQALHTDKQRPQQHDAAPSSISFTLYIQKSLHVYRSERDLFIWQKLPTNALAYLCTFAGLI